MSLEVEKKGYTKESLACPNCNTGLVLYTDDKGRVVKSSDVDIDRLGDHRRFQCKYCESTLSYQPRPLVV